MWGVKVHSPGMDVSEALRSFIDTVSGATVEFFAYHDGADGVTVANQYFGIGKNGVQIRVPGGVTYTATTTGNGFTYMFDGMTSLAGREDPISLYDFNSYPYESILVKDHAQLESVGNISLSGKSYVAAYMLNSGRFYQRNGNFSVRDFTHSGIFSNRGSAFEVHDRTGMIITKHPVGYGIGDYANPYSNLGHGIYCAVNSSCTFTIPVVQVGIPYSNRGTANEAGRYVGFMSNSDASAADYVAFFNTEMPNNSLLRCSDMSTVNFSAASAYPHTVSWDGGVGKESSNPEVGLISAAEASSFTGIGAIRHIWNPSMGFGSPAIQVGIMTRAPYGSATTSAINQWLYNAPRGATLWFSTNSTGWIGSAAPSSSATNYAYMDTVYYSGDALQKTFNEPQRAAAYEANPPGYSGPAVRTSNMMTVNPYGG
jgi:hypothetical protein